MDVCWPDHFLLIVSAGHLSGPKGLQGPWKSLDLGEAATVRRRWKLAVCGPSNVCAGFANLEELPPGKASRDRRGRVDEQSKIRLPACIEQQIPEKDIFSASLNAPPTAVTPKLTIFWTYTFQDGPRERVGICILSLS